MRDHPKPILKYIMEVNMQLNELMLEGTRIRIEPLQFEHISKLWDSTITEEVWRYLPNRFSSIEELIKIYETSLQNKILGTEFPLIVFDKTLDKYVGSTRFLNISLENRNLEIGWTWYFPEVWSTRVNTECKYLLLKYCFEDLDLLRVQLKADTRNQRSNKAIERIGAKREGELRKDRIMQDGFIRNAYIYSILSNEWDDLKEHFEGKLLK